MKTIYQLQLLLLIAMSPLFIAHAQNLPNIQKKSVRAPLNIKIDGKATEWGDKFQAYNHATQVFYTVANDAKRIYLVVHADKREIINKIINGGVSFTVIKNGKKSIDRGPTITYPVFSWRDHPSVNFTAMAEIIPGENDAEKKKDSLIAISNASLEEKAKFIRVIGVSDIDTLISVYNTDGIKARSAFDNKMGYNVEIAIDLKVFGISADDLVGFNYNITLNGVQFDFIPGIDVQRDDAGTITSINITSDIARKYDGTASSTDCWGRYMLVK